MEYKTGEEVEVLIDHKWVKAEYMSDNTHWWTVKLKKSGGVCRVLSGGIRKPVIPESKFNIKEIAVINFEKVKIIKKGYETAIKEWIYKAVSLEDGRELEAYEKNVGKIKQPKVTNESINEKIESIESQIKEVKGMVEKLNENEVEFHVGGVYEVSDREHLNYGQRFILHENMKNEFTFYSETGVNFWLSNADKKEIIATLKSGRLKYLGQAKCIINLGLQPKTGVTIHKGEPK
jgi:hypothetical protein